MQKQIAWNTGNGNITLTYEGQGNGAISVSSDANDLGTERSQVITVQTTDGAVVKNLTVKQAACPVPVGTVLNYPYSGAVKEVLLPAGRYKLQCWGAEGGTAGSYAGGKGGYSEGEITLASPTAFYIFVGGKGGASGNGGWNGGGGGSGSASYTSGGVTGSSKMACGGGATDIALVTSSMSYASYRTNRSDASLLSRMIVAGGGSGGAYTNREETVETTEWQSVYSVIGTRLTIVKNSEELIDGKYVTIFNVSGYSVGDTIYVETFSNHNGGNQVYINGNRTDVGSHSTTSLAKYVVAAGTTLLQIGILDSRNYNYADDSKIRVYKFYEPIRNHYDYSSNQYHDYTLDIEKFTANEVYKIETNFTVYRAAYNIGNGEVVFDIGEFTIPGNPTQVYLRCTKANEVASPNIKVYKKVNKTTTNTSSANQAGYAGGGATGGGYSSTYQGKQNAAGTNGGFGYGANQTTTNYRHCAACGGGGWYGGGGGSYSDSTVNYVKYSGGGSGFVNTAANASYRPDGYTGLQLDSGTTYAGTTSFESTSGGKETGHSGDGYARITRIA